MNTKPTSGRSGLTISELVISLGISLALLAVLFTFSIAAQRNFNACREYAEATVSEMRVIDFVSRDLRRAVGLPTIDAGGGVIEMSIPNFYDENGEPRTPTINYATRSVEYDAPENHITVRYRVEGGNFIRTVGGQDTVIAENVANFEPRYIRSLGVVTIEMTFEPSFQPTGGGVREATLARTQVMLRNYDPSGS